MALVTNVIKRVDIPHEENEWMELRKLSWKQREKASDVSSDAILSRMKQMGGDIIKAFRETTQEQEADPSKGYDRATILYMGIARWSYDAKIDHGTIDDLDEETAAWAFKEILDMNKPRTEEETKNA